MTHITKFHIFHFACNFPFNKDGRSRSFLRKKEVNVRAKNRIRAEVQTKDTDCPTVSLWNILWSIVGKTGAREGLK